MSSRPPDDAGLSQALVQAWREDRADPSQVRRAYLRFLRKRSTRTRAPALVALGWLAAGMLLGMGTLYAATGAPLRLLGFGSPASEPPTRPALDASRTSRLAPAVAVPAPSAMVPLPQVEREPDSKLAPPASPALAASAREQWQRAARGLREKDFDTADAALRELATQGSGAEREAAQLVRAQLLLSQGSDSEARSLLRALQASARSVPVRQKASELLARPAAAAQSQRSFEPAEGTKPP